MLEHAGLRWDGGERMLRFTLSGGGRVVVDNGIDENVVSWVGKKVDRGELERDGMSERSRERGRDRGRERDGDKNGAIKR